jgi:hypothetical protein
MAPLLFFAAGIGLGLAFDVASLMLALLATTAGVFLLAPQTGPANALLTAFCATTWLQFGFIGGLLSRDLIELRAKRANWLIHQPPAKRSEPSVGFISGKRAKSLHDNLDVEPK